VAGPIFLKRASRAEDAEKTVKRRIAKRCGAKERQRSFGRQDANAPASGSRCSGHRQKTEQHRGANAYATGALNGAGGRGCGVRDGFGADAQDFALIGFDYFEAQAVGVDYFAGAGNVTG
jgi:hypothetical protein